MLKIKFEDMLAFVFILVLTISPIYHIYHECFAKDVYVAHIEKLYHSYKENNQHFFVYEDSQKIKHIYRITESEYKMYKVGDNIKIIEDNNKLYYILFYIAYAEYTLLILAFLGWLTT